MSECGVGKPRCGRGTRCNKKSRHCEGATMPPQQPKQSLKKSPPAAPAPKCGKGAPKCARGTRCNKKTQKCEGATVAAAAAATIQKEIIKEIIQKDPPLKENEVIRPASAASVADPDLVLYVFAHGEVLSEPLKKQIVWFSKVPVNGCILISSDTEEQKNIYKLRKSYEMGIPSKMILNYYCDEMDKDILSNRKSIISYIIIYLRQFIEVYKYFVNKLENKTIMTNKTYMDLMTKIMKVLDTTHNIPLNNTEKKRFTEKEQWETIEAISDFHKYFTEKEDKLYDIFMPPTKDLNEIIKNASDYTNIRIKIKKMYVSFYSMKKLLKDTKNLQCRFMHLKKDKKYTFKDTNMKHFGLYVLYNKKPITNQDEILEYDNITETWRFKKYNLQQYKLSDILEDMRGLGFHNVIVYDMTCNAKSTYTDSKSFSSMAKAITSSIRRRTKKSTDYSAVLPSDVSVI